MDASGPEIRAEIERISEAIRALESGEMDPGEFRRFRVLQGIYPIRGGPDLCLLRIRIPLGRPSPANLETLAAVAERYAGGRPVHLTTRQDVHVYGVRLREIPDALTRLADAGMTTREACGDTVRNILVCPFAGIAREEPFDVSPFADALGRHLLRNPLSQRLPRKFKIAFEGCPRADHVGLSTQDVGARAVLSPSGRPGFRIVLAGGLGALPRAGIELEPFTRCGDLAATVEAVLRLFRRLGDRDRRGRARLKFVAEAMGEEEFREAVIAERKSIARSAWSDPSDHAEPVPVPARVPGLPVLPRWPGAVPQRQDGTVALPARFPAGDLFPDQLRGIAALAEKTGASVRLTPDQGILLADLPEPEADFAAAALRSLGAAPPSSVTIVRCAGTETCTVGTTRARAMAALLERELCPGTGEADDGSPGIRVGISGCANGCGRHLLVDVGLQGVSASVPTGGGANRQAPRYRLFLGGSASGDGRVRFGTPVGRIPVRDVPEAVRRIAAVIRSGSAGGESPGATVSRLGISRFEALLEGLLDPSPGDFGEEDFSDLGPDGPVPFPPDRFGPKAP